MRSRLFVVLAFLAAAFGSSSFSARGMQAVGTWEVVPSPNTGSPNNHLYGVAAIASDDVWAVGTYGDLGLATWQLIQHWDGKEWSLADSPLPTTSSELTAISAVDSQDVWAVGGSGGQVLVEHWDGSAWSIQSHPSTGTGTFNWYHGVAAISADDVWAVGQTDNGGLSKTLAGHWDGSSWSVVPSPSVPNQHNLLKAVTAVPGSNEVWAVGDAGPSAPLIMRWNGTQWSLVPTPNAGIVPHLEGVVAISADDVWAVGWTGGTGPSSGPVTLTMHWNGSAWSVVPSPNPGSTFNYLWGVGAAGTNDVWAVGYYIAPGGDGLTLFLKWNGTAWTQFAGDNTGAKGLAFTLDAVSATDATDVWAVGSNSHALAEHWDGTEWSIAPTPNAGVGENVLTAVSGSASDDVWQVGHFVFGTEHRTLVQHWEGEAWSLVDSPNTNKRLNDLAGVAAISPTDAWAVGDASSGLLDQTTLTLHWDGVSWAIVPSPSPGTAGLNWLRAVSAISTDDVWAVGGSWSGGPHQTVALHWDGTTWSVIPSPNVPGTNTEFYGVAAIAADDVWAVGYHGAFTFATLAAHWDGTSWSLVPIPDPNSSNVLRAVAASGPDDVWAVGTGLNPFTYIVGTVTEHYDGDSWKLSFGVNDYFSTLYGVTAVATDDAWQVGDLGGLALIGHWDGNTWDPFPSPEIGGRLHATSAIDSCDVWAVGQYFVPTLGNQTLSEHYTAPCDTVWTDVGFALSGVAGEPLLAGTGPLTPGSSGALTLTQAASSAASVLFASVGSVPAPFKGGALVPLPAALALPLATSPLGTISLMFSDWPAGLSGLDLYFQYAIQDAAAVKGVALSNALKADVP